MHTALYQRLGVKPDAGDVEIRQAFRRLAQHEHPDKGGDTSTWQSIQLAYDVLSDPQRRSRYDQSGQTDAPDAQAMVLQELAGALMAVIDGCSDPRVEDLVASTSQVIRDAQQKRYEQIDMLKRQIRRREVAVARLPLELAQLLYGDMAQRRQAIHQTEEQREVGAKALRLLAKHGMPTQVLRLVV